MNKLLIILSFLIYLSVMLHIVGHYLLVQHMDINIIVLEVSLLKMVNIKEINISENLKTIKNMVKEPIIILQITRIKEMYIKVVIIMEKLLKKVSIFLLMEQYTLVSLKMRLSWARHFYLEKWN